MQDQFETVIAKHGESLIYDILENWERHMGIKYANRHLMTLERRWEIFWRTTEPEQQRAAA